LIVVESSEAAVRDDEDVLRVVAAFLPPLTPLSALLILTWIDVEVAVAPLLSFAVAAAVYIPTAIFDHAKAYGLIVELPTTLELAP
jgi:hypothetical protein